MNLEALNDALILWLNMCCQIWFEIHNLNLLQIIWDDVTAEIILEKEDIVLFPIQFCIPLMELVLVDQ